VILFPATTPVRGQVFQLGAGSSSLFQAHGGSLSFQSPKYEGWVGVGNLDGFRLGASLKTQLLGSTLTFGDESIPFRLPTDIFDSSHYFLGRGIGVTHIYEGVSLFGFVGASSLGFGTPFFRAAEASRGVGAFFLDAPLTPTLRAFSRNVFSDRQTTINGLEWRPSRGLRTAWAGGVGTNQGYFASSLRFDREWISAKAAYVEAGNQFRRIGVRVPLSSEMDRENILVTLRPKPFLSLSAGRQNFLQPTDRVGPGIRGTVNQYMASLAAGHFTLNGAIFKSHSPGAANTGTSVSIGRGIAGWLHLRASLFHSRPAHASSVTSFLATLREVISPRLSLLQLVNYSNGQTSVSFGGNFISNRISIGVDYQTVYVPFRTGNQFKQVIALNLRLQPFGNFQLNGGTFVAPDGTVKYTVYGNTYFYRGPLGAASPTAMTLYKYIVRGKVVDVEGRPVRGAALRIDGDLAFTDSRGDFFVRKRKSKAYRLEVLPDQFLIPGSFQVVSAPTSVRAAPEEKATEITVVVRRLTPPSH
jgi:hypothetical protein